MYSQNIIERNISKVEHDKELKLTHYPPGIVGDWKAQLDKVLNDKGVPSRPLHAEEKAFIRNARLLSMLDFRWWTENFCMVLRDGVVGGGLGLLRLWDTQEILLRRIAQLEEENDLADQRGEQIDGILLADHKGGRQLGHTALARALAIHRALFWPHTRGLAGSVDDTMVQELYDKDHIVFDNLPWWMRPEFKFDVKSQHIELATSGSTVLYQIASQKGGIGVGRQVDVGHITELSTFEQVAGGDPTRLELEFFPTLPQSPKTLCLLESTANGRGNWWHSFTERVRQGRTHRWRYVFIPWYAEPRKYRRTPPPDWQPSQVSMLHAQHVHETSAEFTGKSILLPKEQLYWWETSRAEAQEGGTLNIFLTNYAATPEESFQHSGRSSFSTELLEVLSAGARPGRAFDLGGV